jgi:hypothetical protein
MIPPLSTHFHPFFTHRHALGYALILEALGGNLIPRTTARSVSGGSGQVKERTVSITVRKRNGTTSIRVQIGSLAITVEFPL